MNKQQRTIYAQRHLRTVQKMDSPFISLISRAIAAQVSHVARVLRSDGIEAAKRSIPDAALSGPLVLLYKTYAVWQARKTAQEITRSEVKAGFGINQDLVNRIVAYFEQNLLVKAVMRISETTRNIILAALISGQQQGLGVNEIVAKIEGIPRVRAELIVRTEAVIAMQYGRQQAVKASRWETESVWIAADDNRTRHSHRYIDGARIKEGARFSVPIYKGDTITGYDFMSGPGDPTASAGNVCNCRCSMATVAKRDAQGKLIPKRNISVILPGEIRHHQIITV